MMKNQADEIKTTFIEGAKEWAIGELIKQGIMRLTLMLNPAGAIATTILAIYNTVMYFYNNWTQITEFVTSIFDSIASIASGAIGAASALVEQVLAKTIPLILDFIAQMLNLGGIVNRIQAIIERVRGKVDKIIDIIIKWVKDKAKTIFNALTGRGGATNPQQQNPHKKPGDQEVGDDIPFSAAGQSHHLWIDTTGEVEVMVASTPLPVVKLIDRWRKKEPAKISENSAKLDNAISLRGTVVAAALKARALKQKMDDHKDDQSLAAQFVAADNDTEAKEQVLKGALVELFEIFGDEHGVLETFKDQLKAIDPTAKFEIYAAIEKNSEAWSKIKEWPGLVDVLDTAHPASTLFDSPLNSKSAFGQSFDAAMSQCFESALAEAGITDEEKAKFKSDKAGWLQNQKANIHGRSQKAAPILTLLQGQILNNANRAAISAAMHEYFKLALVDADIPNHDYYKVEKVELSAQEKTLVVKYFYEVEVRGKKEKRSFVGTVSLVGDDIVQSTEGTNLVLKDVGSRGIVKSVNNAKENEKLKQQGVTKDIEMNASHILADMFLGSGYKNALNLITTSAEYNQVTMKTEEDAIKRELKDVEKEVMRKDSNAYITFDITVTATTQSIKDEKVEGAIEKELKTLTGEKLNNSEHLIAVHEFLASRTEPRLCKKVVYKVTHIYKNGTDLIANPIDAKTILEDIYLKAVL